MIQINFSWFPHFLESMKCPVLKLEKELTQTFTILIKVKGTAMRV